MRARAWRAAQGRRHCGAARGGWPASGRGPGRRGRWLVPGARCGVGALGTKHLRWGAGRQLLCNLSPSRTGAASLRRRLGLRLGCRGRRERPKEVVLGPGTCGAPSPLPSLPLHRCAGRPRLACRCRGAGSGAAHLAPVGLRAAWQGVRESSSAAGGGRGGQGFGPMESWSQPIPGGGFPALAAGACFLGFPLSSRPVSPPPFSFTLPPTPQPSSRLLQCGGCGYLVNCNCGPLQWERSFLLGFYIYVDPAFSRVFASSCSSGSKLEGDCCRTHRMIKKTCAINYSWRLGWEILRGPVSLANTVLPLRV